MGYCSVSIFTCCVIICSCSAQSSSSLCGDNYCLGGSCDNNTCTCSDLYPTCSKPVSIIEFMFILVHQNSQAAVTVLFIEGLKITYDILIHYTHIILAVVLANIHVNILKTNIFVYSIHDLGSVWVMTF